MKKDHMEVLLEQVVSQNKAILEGIKSLPTRADFNELKQDVTELKQDVKSIKAAVTDASHDLTEHKQLPADKAHGSGQVGRSRWAAA